MQCAEIMVKMAKWVGTCLILSLFLLVLPHISLHSKASSHPKKKLRPLCIIQKPLTWSSTRHPWPHVMTRLLQMYGKPEKKKKKLKPFSIMQSSFHRLRKRLIRPRKPWTLGLFCNAESTRRKHRSGHEAIAVTPSECSGRH